MDRTREAVDAYGAMLLGDSPERRFLESVPWEIDAGPQPTHVLLRALRLEAPRLAELPRRSLFSLVAPLRAGPERWLNELILSARCQSYVGWELILVDDGRATPEQRGTAGWWADRDPRIRLDATESGLGDAGAREFGVGRSCGDFLVMLDGDELIHPSALGAFARRINREPSPNYLFANEASIDVDSRAISWYATKPPFDLFTLLRSDYACRFAAIGRDLARRASAGGPIYRPEAEGFDEHDLAIRLALTGEVRPVHLPLFLRYARLADDGRPRPRPSGRAVDHRRAAVLCDVLPRAYPGARFEVAIPGIGDTRAFPSIKIRSLADHPRPSLLALVPFRDNVGETLACLESLEHQEHDLDVAVALIDNGSERPETGLALDEWLGIERRLRYERVDHPGAFNYARLNHAGIERHGEGRDLLLFLNNDVELGSPDGLQTMAMQALADPRCGFVGIRLLYPEGVDVQHGGVRITEVVAGSGYTFVDHSKSSSQFVADERIAFGVTFACAMVRRAVFEELGGLDEVLYPNAYGDVDLCARALEAGYRNYYFGTLAAVHHESKTRGQTAEEIEFTALHEQHAAAFASWRLRDLTLAERHVWPIPAPISAPPPAPEPRLIVVERMPAVLPLRYRLADALNASVKRLAGPLHRLACRAASARRMRPGPIPRPHRPTRADRSSPSESIG